MCGGSLGDRSLSQEEEIRRFSFGLDPDTFTEVEICEKTFSFKISTDIRPLPGWSSSSSSSSGGVVGGNGSCQNGRQPSSAFRRASLAVMSACKLFSNLKRKAQNGRSSTCNHLFFWIFVVPQPLPSRPGFWPVGWWWPPVVPPTVPHSQGRVLIGPSRKRRMIPLKSRWTCPRQPPPAPRRRRPMAESSAKRRRSNRRRITTARAGQQTKSRPLQRH